MSRQWDTKRQFKADYKNIANLVFFGWAVALRNTEWRWALSHLGWGVSALLRGLTGAVLGLVFLVTSPVSFPLACAVAKMNERRQRLDYLRRQRAADEDI